MTKVTLVCKTCGYKARRELANIPGCRGVHETPSVIAKCPQGHGLLVREDFNEQKNT